MLRVSNPPLTSSHTISVHAGPSCSISTTPSPPPAAAASLSRGPPPLPLSVPSTAGQDATVALREPPLPPARLRRNDAAAAEALHSPFAREAAEAVGGNSEQPHRLAGTPAAPEVALGEVVVVVVVVVGRA